MSADTPMMTCGHAANAKTRQADGTDVPSCAICGCVTVQPNAPDLTGRRARCSYYGRSIRMDGRGRSECDQCNKRARERGSNVCTDERDSTERLPFFAYCGPGTKHYKGEQKFDEFYCGCMGWD